MKYEVEFRASSGETKRVIVTLEPDEISSASMRSLHCAGLTKPGLWQCSYATRHGYRNMPDGFDYFAATAIPDSLLMTAIPTNGTRGKRPQLLSPVGAIGEGPAMAGLNDRQKKFVRALIRGTPKLWFSRICGQSRRIWHSDKFQ